MEETKKELQSLLTRLCEIVPTLLFIGMSADELGAFMMDSPMEDKEKCRLDLSITTAIMMARHDELKVVIFRAVSLFLKANPMYLDEMQKALDKLKELDEHQRTSKSK